MKLVLLLVCLSLVTAERKYYNGYQVLTFTVNNPDQKSTLDMLKEDIELDFWTVSPRYGAPIDLMVPPHRLTGVKELLTQAHITFTIKNSNVQKLLDVEFERLKDTRAFNLSDYNTLEDIEAELPEMAARCPSEISCELYSLGYSYEGRDLTVLKISGGEGRQAHWFDSAIHGREYMSSATNLYIMDHMTRNYGIDADVTNLVDRYDFYFLPIMNPDGYEYTWTTDRLWRKSRNINSEGVDGMECNGTDLNRNYDYMWGNVGTSNFTCAQTYQGSAPASEPETQLLQAEINRVAPQLVSLTSIHTYGEVWLHPWGWVDENGNCTRADDHDDMYQVANATVRAVEQTHDTHSWDCGIICEIFYPAAGSTIDYAKGVSGVKYTYTPELRGDNFWPPPEEIVLSFEEVWNGILAMVEEIEAIGNM